MGKVPIRLKEVVYTLSPFQQSVMGGLWKDLPHKAAHHAHNVSLAARRAGWGPQQRRRRVGRGRGQAARAAPSTDCLLLDHCLITAV